MVYNSAQMATSKLNFSKRRLWTQAGIVGFIIILLIAVVPQLDSFSDSWQYIGHAKLHWLAFSIVSMLVSYFLAAGTYRMLVPEKFNIIIAAFVQAAAMCANRILPAGAGALGVSYRFLRQVGRSPGQAAAAVTVNNILGLLGNILLIIVLTVTTHSSLPELHINPRLWLSIIGIVIVIIGLLISIKTWRKKILRAARELAKDISAYREQPLKLLFALLFSTAVTTCYSLILFGACRAVGIGLSLAQITIVMSVGVTSTSALPTPGGIGVAEAAITASLVVYHISSSTALAAAILYRIVIYWLPLFLGGFALFVSLRRKYI